MTPVQLQFLFSDTTQWYYIYIKPCLKNKLGEMKMNYQVILEKNGSMK